MQVSTEKLQIRRITAYNAYWFAIRFSGPEKAFKAMVYILQKYGRRGAYWHSGVFKHGAWVVRNDILMRYVDKFENLEPRMNIARMTADSKAKAEK